MRTLNRGASEILVANGVIGVTDVTGFGLLGHGLEMARASGTRFVIEAGALPSLPGAIDLARDGVETGGAAHNRRFVLDDLEIRPNVRDELVTLAHDPQTSGGLLAALPPDRLGPVLAELDEDRCRRLADRGRPVRCRREPPLSPRSGAISRTPRRR
jgi:selenide,water dikinase